jgi:ankyrin repeat protein
MRTRDLGTELCLAVFKSEPEKVEQLLREGADVDAFGDRRVASVANCTPLWLAASLAGQEISQAWGDFCDALSELVPSIPPRNRTGKRQNFMRIATTLILAGANLEKSSHGGTPLRIAVHRNDLEFAQFLLSHGANPNAESFSVLSRLATKQGRKTLPAYYDTLLHEAVGKGSLPIVKALLQAGADPARTDHEGRTPLDIAVDRGYPDIIEALQNATAKK